MHENIDFDMESDFFPRLRLMTNMTDASTDDMYDVCNYLYWAFMNNLDIIFADQLTDEDHNRITLTVNDNVFEKYEAQDELIAFPSFELFNQFNEFAQVLKTSMRWQKTAYFTKYYKVEEHENFPKFIFYSAHAEVLGPLFLAFETEIVTNRNPGSAIFLEYFTEVDSLLNEKLFVKVFYKPTASLDDSDTQVFMIPSIET